jgi:hypothetical protein
VNRPAGKRTAAAVLAALTAVLAGSGLTSAAHARAPEPGIEVAPGVFLESAGHLTAEASSGATAAGARAAGTRVSTAAARIVGGHETTVRKWPWQVAIEYLRPDPYPPLFSCGGSLVAPNVVVTAAHCVTLGSANFRPPSEFGAITGRTRLSSDRGRVHTVEDYYLFVDGDGRPLWDPRTVAWDAVFMVLDEPSAQRPIKIAGPREASVWVPGQRAFITGWGTTRAGSDFEVSREKTSDVLRQGRIRIASDAACNEVYGPVLIPGLMVCAGLGAGGVDACSGDSGGPLVVPVEHGYRLIGDTSFAAGCGQPGIPGVYGRLAADPMRSALGNGIRAMTGANVIGAGASPPNRFALTSHERDRRRGTARLTVNVPGRGKVLLERTRLTREATAWPRRAGAAHLRVRPRGPLRRRLGRGTRRARVAVPITYTPLAGEPRTKRFRVKLARNR